MILGKNAFFVTPSDSVAVLAANADCIPHLARGMQSLGCRKHGPERETDIDPKAVLSCVSVVFLSLGCRKGLWS